MITGGYRRFAYRLFRWIDRKPREGVEQLLYKADVLMLPGMFIGTIVITTLLVTIATFVGSYFFFTYFFRTSLSLIIIIALTGTGAIASLMAFPVITQNKIGSKKVKINNAMPFVLAYMATLSSAGMNPVEVVRHVGLKDFGPASTEFRKIVYRFEVLGEDIITSINYIALNTPSQSLHDILIGISNIIIAGGSLRSYCDQESKNLFDERRNKLKQFIDSLGAYSEGYLGGILVALIMGVVAVILIGSLGIKVAPFLSTQDLMLILIFFAVPFVNIVYLGLLELKFSGDET